VHGRCVAGAAGVTWIALLESPADVLACRIGMGSGTKTCSICSPALGSICGAGDDGAEGCSAVVGVEEPVASGLGPSWPAGDSMTDRSDTEFGDDPLAASNIPGIAASGADGGSP
jgi:hypothetical protein